MADMVLTEQQPLLQEEQHLQQDPQLSLQQDLQQQKVQLSAAIPEEEDNLEFSENSYVGKL
jgi:hypothetical protein